MFVIKAWRQLMWAFWFQIKSLLISFLPQGQRIYSYMFYRWWESSLLNRVELKRIGNVFLRLPALIEVTMPAILMCMSFGLIYHFSCVHNDEPTRNIHTYVVNGPKRHYFWRTIISKGLEQTSHDVTHTCYPWVGQFQRHGIIAENIIAWKCPCHVQISLLWIQDHQ